ncbi:uncharacterized protein LOC109837605 [Asparagus officinalis]|uniref:uncharacterized protein LOC109837605 n=1 Tax=Asparagus officinalis TaxID=4686 RepID=UPI00098DF994|nr:uncharacterized protein LOC109837605 [Asparagus officinalis]XP_020261508.1 uncharacterized protein LOC109837605 [Asparagus officinalis]XP_020261509.1 uncharacterized protein LOC109837605 [Asparagus officinalis]
MASLTPAVLQNENLHIHRGKSLEGGKTGALQNENLHVHRGKGVEGLKHELPKPVKNRQERKALRDLSQAPKPLHPALKEKSGLTILKDKAPTRETAKKAPKRNILTDEEIARCQEWAKEGIEHMHFSGNDMRKLEAQQQEERVRKKVDKAMAGLRAWTDMTFGLEIPVKEIPSDTEDSLKLEFEEEVLPPSPRVNAHSKSGYENIEDLFELDDSLYFDQQFELKLKEEGCE